MCQRTKFTIPALCITHKVVSGQQIHYNVSNIVLPGELVALHRKVHLFDIEIPGKIVFKVLKVPTPYPLLFDNPSQESTTLTGGDSLNYFDTGMYPLSLSE